MKKTKRQPQSFSDHLHEMRRRFGFVAVFLIAGSIVGFSYHQQIEKIIQKPLGQTLYFTNPGGGLSFAVQISLGVGVIFALPVALYQIAQFIKPAVKPMKTRVIVGVVIASMVLSVLAVVYTYYVSMPAALTFLVGFNSEAVQALINVSDYMSFMFAYFAGSVIAFQFPLILLFINKVKKIPPGGLLKMQKPVIVGIFVISGILTPTVDPINQLLMAVPMMILFELGVMAVWSTNRQRARTGLRASRKARKQPEPFRISYTPSTPLISRESVARSIKLLPGVLEMEKVMAKTFDINITSQTETRASTSDNQLNRRGDSRLPRRLIVDFQ